MCECIEKRAHYRSRHRRRLFKVTKAIFVIIVFTSKFAKVVKVVLFLLPLILYLCLSNCWLLLRSIFKRVCLFVRGLLLLLLAWETPGDGRRRIHRVLSGVGIGLLGHHG